jgi:hypothetical protein
MSDWQPLFDRGDRTWVGAGENPGIWVGLPGAPGRLVDLENPVFLWPLLELPLADVTAELERFWEEFKLEEESVGSIVKNVAISALRSGREYWMSLSFSWLEEMAEKGLMDPEIAALNELDEASMSQRSRHRLARLRRQTKG